MSEKNLSRYLPEGVSWLRAAVSAIPMVGGALDHLIFDKADAIRLRNIETALKALAGQVEQFGAEKVSKEWFSSEEALAAFKQMADYVSYEPDEEKIKDMGRVVAACGEHTHVEDNNKLAVLEHLSRLSHIQIKLLSVIAKVSKRERKISTGDIVQTANAIWLSDIITSLKAGPQFWSGMLKIDEELEVLESYNTLRRVQLMGPSELAYEITAIGRWAASYLHTAQL